jgi:hypothetical protein
MATHSSTKFQTIAKDTATVKFNVGGLRYEVSRSLLEMHSESMLTKIASDQWQEEPKSEFVIERNGSTFRHVLKYLRDGKVKLPITETKSDLIEELAYYNIDHDAGKIDDSNEHQVNLVTTAQETINDLKSDSITFYCNEIASHCLNTYMLKRVMSVTREGVERPVLQNDKLRVVMSKDSLYGGAACSEHAKQLYKIGDHAQVKLTIKERMDIHLNKVGLAVSNIDYHAINCLSCYISKRV